MEIHVYFHNDESELMGKLAKIQSSLHALLEQEKKIMATLSDVQAAVTAEDTVVDSAISCCCKGWPRKWRRCNRTRRRFDALAADISGKTKALADAVAANTPAAP